MPCSKGMVYGGGLRVVAGDTSRRRRGISVCWEGGPAKCCCHFPTGGAGKRRRWKGKLLIEQCFPPTGSRADGKFCLMAGNSRTQPDGGGRRWITAEGSG